MCRSPENDLGNEIENEEFLLFFEQVKEESISLDDGKNQSTCPTHNQESISLDDGKNETHLEKEKQHVSTLKQTMERETVEFENKLKQNLQLLKDENLSRVDINIHSVEEENVSNHKNENNLNTTDGEITNDEIKVSEFKSTVKNNIKKVVKAEKAKSEAEKRNVPLGEGIS